MTNSDQSLILHGDLGFEARQAFIAAARTAMESSDRTVELDSSAIDVIGPIDDPVIGMLVTLARAAHRQGRQVTLLRAPRQMRFQLETAAVDHLFTWKPQT